MEKQEGSLYRSQRTRTEIQIKQAFHKEKDAEKEKEKTCNTLIILNT